MNTFRRQRGVSALGVMVTVGMFGFILMCAMRLFPTYMEGRGVKQAIETVLEKEDIPESSLHEIRRRLERSFLTNQIDTIYARDIIIKRDGDLIQVDATYESRIPLVANIDAVVMHNNLVWEFQRR